MNLRLIFLGLMVFVTGAGEQEHPSIKVMDSPLIKGEAGAIEPYFVPFNDTIGSDTLFLQLTNNGLPQSVYRNINTGVCLDGECRRLRIRIYWDITGKYLGFKVPEGEFLSKTQHVPFTREEYQQLHQLLRNPYSSLGNYSIDELISVPGGEEEDTDAVSSATIKDVLSSVVEGAVYTSYTLWHIVYGDSRREVQTLSRECFSESIAMLLLEGTDIDGQVWALVQLAHWSDWSDRLQQKVLSMISSSDYYLVERAINSFPEELFSTEAFQAQLLPIFINADYPAKRLLLQRFSSSDYRSDALMHTLAESMDDSNGSLTQNILELFISAQVTNPEICLHIADLLESNNRFLAQKAYLYLSQLSTSDRKLKRRLKSYRRH